MDADACGEARPPTVGRCGRKTALPVHENRTAHAARARVPVLPLTISEVVQRVTKRGQAIGARLRCCVTDGADRRAETRRGVRERA